MIGSDEWLLIKTKNIDVTINISTLWIVKLIIILNHHRTNNLYKNKQMKIMIDSDIKILFIYLDREIMKVIIYLSNKYKNKLFLIMKNQ